MKLHKTWWILAVLSLGVMIPFSAPYFTLDPLNSRIPITSEPIQFPLLITHIGTAMIALIAGFFQFIDVLRLKRPRVHRYIGRVYVVSVMISGLAAIGLFFFENDYAKAMSFLFLALLWLFTCWKGYRAAVDNKWADHRKWMIRSFAVTLVAVSARLLVPFLILAFLANHGFSFSGFSREGMIQAVLDVNIWAGLIINLLIVEWRIFRQAR